MKGKKSTDEPSFSDLVARYQNVETSEQAGPTGVVAESLDGRVFFIPDTQAESLQIESHRLYKLYRAGEGPGKVPQRSSPCGRTKRWLDSHSPDSALWRLRVLLYFDLC